MGFEGGRFSLGLQDYIQDSHRPFTIPVGLWESIPPTSRVRAQSLLGRALKLLDFDEVASGEKRKLQLLELEEMRMNAYESSKIYKQKMKAYHDKKLQRQNFQPGQQILLFNSRIRLFKGKLKSKWSGPFVIKEVRPHGAVELVEPIASTPEKRWIVNGQRLKIYNGGQLERLTSVVYLNDP